MSGPHFLLLWLAKFRPRDPGQREMMADVWHRGWGAIIGQQGTAGTPGLCPFYAFFAQGSTDGANWCCQSMGGVEKSCLMCFTVMKSVPWAIPEFCFWKNFGFPSFDVSQAPPGRKFDILALLC